MSLLKKNPSKIFLKKNQKYIILLFLPDRQRNYQRVNQRFVNMFKNGAVQEVERLLKFKLKNNLPVMKAHGVPEISLFLKNKINEEECISKSQQVTRNYVKRQHTWWNGTNLEIFKKIDQFPDQIDLKLMNFI